MTSLPEPTRPAEMLPWAAAGSAYETTDPGGRTWCLWPVRSGARIVGWNAAPDDDLTAVIRVSDGRGGLYEALDLATIRILELHGQGRDEPGAGSEVSP